MPAQPDRGEVASRELDLFYKVMGSLPNPDPILRRSGGRMEVYEELLRDDQVAHAVEVVEMAVKSFEITIDDNGASSKHVAFLKEVMELWNHAQIVEDALRARLFGFQPFEFLWEPVDGRWIITGIVGKPQEWFAFDKDNTLTLRRNGKTDQALNPWNFYVAQHKASYKNPYGTAVLSRTFWPVTFKKGGVKFWLTFLEKFAIPYLVGKQPRNLGQPETDKFLGILEDMIQDAVIVIPDDSSVEIKEAGGKGASGELFERHVRYHDKTIMKTIAGSTLVSDDGNGTGSYGLSKTHAATTEAIVDAVKKHVLGIYNTAFKRMTMLNASHEPVPKARFHEEEDVQKPRAERDNILVQTGIKFTKKYYEDTYNLNSDDFDIAPTPQPGATLFEHASGCTCGCQTVAFEAAKLPTDQIVEDQAIDTTTAPDSPHTAAFTKPVVEALQIIRSAETPEQALTQLAEAYPDLDVTELEDKLTRALFVSQVWGRISIQNEDPS